MAIYWYIILFIAATFGGLVGSLSGGAGMITMPLLLLSGINPLYALATNKLQACVGSFTGAAHYYSQGLVDMRQTRVRIIISVIGASIGAISVQFVRVEILSKILPFVMIAIGLYFLLSPSISDKDRAKSPKQWLLLIACAGASFYGGLLGVGIGTIILSLLVGIGGYGLSRALGDSRWIVFSINVASTLLFIIGGNVLWLLGITMCVGQAIGARFGAKLAIKHGAKIIKPIVICLCFIISAQLIFKEFF
ncbi:hypothetical protein CQA44_01435 [Helicobacter sp. MIT 14-3879]|nr:hypothetical protein CQA44_01435 [Helicobacter sp. MIT 14-3879]